MREMQLWITTQLSHRHITRSVIPANAGIQALMGWIPDQVGNDKEACNDYVKKVQVWKSHYFLSSNLTFTSNSWPLRKSRIITSSPTFRL